MLMRRAEVDVSILSSGHNVADARLHRLASALVERGLTVEVRGLGNIEAGPPRTRVQTAPRGSLPRRAVRAVVLPWLASGRAVIVLDPELVLPGLLCRAVQRLARRDRNGPRLVVDVHEDYSAVLWDRPWARGPLRLLINRLVWIAQRASRYADLTIVADDHIPPLDARSRLVLRNVPVTSMLPPPGSLEPAPRALYVGDVRQSRGLQRMVEIFETLPEWSLDVVGPVAPIDRAWLARWRRTSAAQERIRFHGRLPPREAWRLAEGAWVGLCLLSPTPAFVQALPSKLLEYLACGLSVISTPLPRAVALLAESGAGRTVGDPVEAVELLRAWAARPAEVEACRLRAQTWVAEQRSWQDQYAVFGEIATRLVRG